MKPGIAKRERGVVLLALLALIALSASWYLVSRLNAESGAAAAVRKTRNAEVLNRAKQALIGYVAKQAAEAGERNPGRLPCPEAMYNIGTSDEGSSAPWIGPPATTTCTSIGRLPWRTIGLEKLVDTTNEPLWYAVGPAWRLTTSTSTLLINSNTVGDIIVDGQQTVALIIAPGAAMNSQASAGCVARNQARSVPSATINARDYIECFDSATLQFITTASSASFNDQVMRVTVADIMPAIEAAITNRIEREIVPVLKTAYASSNWGTSSTNPLYPFPAPFSSPGTSNYQGAAGTYAGLLPFNHTTAGCNPATDPRCAPTLVSWTTPRVTQTGGTGAVWGAPSCVVGATYSYCEDWYIGGTVQITYKDIMANVAKALRTYAFDPASYYMETWAYNNDLAVWNFIASGTPSGQTRHFNSDGSFSLSFVAPTVPQYSGWGYYYVYVTRNPFSFSDHSLLSASDPTTGWFVRNEWYRLSYYAVAQGHTASAAPGTPACAPGTNCLSVANVTPAWAQRAILILGGRSVNGTSRPSATLADYLESGNATGAFTRKTISASAAIPTAQRFNDRVVVIDSN